MIISIRVKPNAKQEKLEHLEDGSWLACVHAPPVDGKANKRLIQMLSDHFNIPKSQIKIQSGESSKLKRVLIGSD